MDLKTGDTRLIIDVCKSCGPPAQSDGVCACNRAGDI